MVLGCVHNSHCTEASVRLPVNSNIEKNFKAGRTSKESEVMQDTSEEDFRDITDFCQKIIH